MNFLESIFLGIIQGLTEFLPISSTGHLTLAGKLLNLINPDNPERWTAFIAVIQLGTMAAVIIYFWKDLYSIFISFLKDNLFKPVGFNKQSDNSKLGWLIIAGSVPVVVIGLVFKDFIEGHFTKNLYVISLSLIILAIILAFAEKFGKFNKDIKNITIVDAIIVGFAQALALIPGSSRSGTTITAGLFLGFGRETAARFSFLLSIPAVLGSGLLEFYHEFKHLDNSGLVTLAIATIVSAISGYAAIAFLINFLKKNTTFVFVFYRIFLGLSILLLLYFNVIKP